MIAVDSRYTNIHTRAMDVVCQHFVIPIEPVPCSRPRVTRNGTYNPPAMTAAKQTIQFLVTSKPHSVHSGAVKLTLKFFVKKPKRTKNIYPSVKPDIDNYAKLVMDALNGFLWKDDGQVIQLSVYKLYSDNPSIHIWSEDVI